jgi:glycosyltransferase involved in cell wall biosynthesis
MRKRVFKSLDGVVALAQPYLDAVIKVEPPVKEKPNTVIYNGINVSEFRRVMSGPTSFDFDKLAEMDTVKIIFAGSLGPSYDVSAILKVAEVTCRQNLPISIFIAGDGPLKSVVKSAANNLPCLHYFGQLAPSDLCSLYSICDIGLVAYGQASNVEMPDKFYDYTAAGLALVNSLQGEVQSLIDEYELGLTYKAGDAEDLLLAIQRFIGDEEALSRCKENSFNCAENFCSTLQNDKLNVFLSEVITSFKNSK